MTNEELFLLINKYLRYYPDTGLFTWRISPNQGILPGSVAGSLTKDGYVEIRFKRKKYKAHRLAWFVTYKKWPVGHIDHINGVKKDNRLVNLRDSNYTENQANRGKQLNNTSGYKGVYKHSKSNKWEAKIGVSGRSKYLGLFDTPEEAHEAYKKAAKNFFGEFAKY